MRVLCLCVFVCICVTLWPKGRLELSKKNEYIQQNAKMNQISEWLKTDLWAVQVEPEC